MCVHVCMCDSEETILLYIVRYRKNVVIAARNIERTVAKVVFAFRTDETRVTDALRTLSTLKCVGRKYAVCLLKILLCPLILLLPRWLLLFRLLLL